MITLGLGNIVPKRRESSSDVLQAVPETVERRDPSSAVLQALSETVAWCLSKSLQNDQLRSRQLDPSAILKVPSLDEVGVEVLLQRMHESYQRAIYAINETRSTLVRDTKIEIVEPALAQSRGKFLLYEPLETVTDGAAASSSRGFFDISDAPPWDTWFLYSGDTIFSWVPESLVPNAQAGIDANPVDCIHWSDWSKLSEPLI
jgi:hypothetical protein